MKQIAKTIDCLAPAKRRRVISWVMDKINEDESLNLQSRPTNLDREPQEFVEGNSSAEGAVQ